MHVHVHVFAVNSNKNIWNGIKKINLHDKWPRQIKQHATQVVLVIQNTFALEKVTKTKLYKTEVFNSK